VLNGAVKKSGKQHHTKMSMKRITVLLAEDHMIVREGFRKMLELEDDLEVVGEAQDGRAGGRAGQKIRPDVVLMDIAMPLLNGLEATRQFSKSSPPPKCSCSPRTVMTRMSKTRPSPARGISAQTNLRPRRVPGDPRSPKGKTFFSPSISRRQDRLNPSSPDRAGCSKRKPSELTSREMEVLQLIAEGKANKETAAELGIGIKTVEKHREHLMEKLDIHDTAGLTRYAISAGIIESSVQLTIV
jgi:DNA-binding NarL/FixJ family response regulator